MLIGLKDAFGAKTKAVEGFAAASAAYAQSLAELRRVHDSFAANARERALGDRAGRGPRRRAGPRCGARLRGAAVPGDGEERGRRDRRARGRGGARRGPSRDRARRRRGAHDPRRPGGRGRALPRGLLRLDRSAPRHGAPRLRGRLRRLARRRRALPHVPPRVLGPAPPAGGVARVAAHRELSRHQRPQPQAARGERVPRASRRRAHAGPEERDGAAQGAGDAADPEREDVLPRADGRRRRARGEYAARVRQGEPGDGEREHAEGGAGARGVREADRHAAFGERERGRALGAVRRLRRRPSAAPTPAAPSRTSTRW